MRNLSYLLFERALITALVLVVPASAQIGLGLSPMRVEWSGVPRGGFKSGVLTIANDGSEPVRVSAELLDFYLDDAANPQFSRNWPKESAFTCRSWLTVNPMEAEILPESQLTVRYSLRVPPDAEEKSYHCAVGFTTQPTRGGPATGTALRTAVRMVAAFYAVVGAPAVDGILRSLTIESTPGKGAPGWQLAAVIENTGLRYFRPTGTVEVVGPDGAAEQVSFVPLPTLPKRTQRYVFPLRQVTPGSRYSIRARLDIGNNEIQEGSAVVVTEQGQAAR